MSKEESKKQLTEVDILVQKEAKLLRASNIAFGMDLLAKYSNVLRRQEDLEHPIIRLTSEIWFPLLWTFKGDTDPRRLENAKLFTGLTPDKNVAVMAKSFSKLVYALVEPAEVSTTKQDMLVLVRKLSIWDRITLEGIKGKSYTSSNYIGSHLVYSRYPLQETSHLSQVDAAVDKYIHILEFLNNAQVEGIEGLAAAEVKRIGVELPSYHPEMVIVNLNDPLDDVFIAERILSTTEQYRSDYIPGITHEFQNHGNFDLGWSMSEEEVAILLA